MPSPQQDAFAFWAKCIDKWLESAEKLKRGADAVLAEHDRQLQTLLPTLIGQVPGKSILPQDFMANNGLIDVHVFLAGLCIENLLKGILVHANPDLVEPNGTLHKDIRTHDVFKLTRNAGLDADLNADERRFLELAENAIPFWGRYHIPVNHQQMNADHAWHQNYTTAFRRLFRKWAERLIRATATQNVKHETAGQPKTLSIEQFIRWRLDGHAPGQC